MEFLGQGKQLLCKGRIFPSKHKTANSQFTKESNWLDIFKDISIIKITKDINPICTGLERSYIEVGLV